MIQHRNFHALRCAIVSRVVRALTDMNQGQMAKSIGVTRTTITSIESLEKIPRPNTAAELVLEAVDRGIVFEFDDDGIHIHVSNIAALSLLDKLDPFSVEEMKNLS